MSDIAVTSDNGTQASIVTGSPLQASVIQAASNTFSVSGALQGPKGDTGATGAAGTTDYTQLTNKPTLAIVATTGSYTDLANKPTIPTANSQLTNDSSYATTTALSSGLATKANTTHTHTESDVTGLTTDLAAKQATLVSGTNIKTVNGNSLLGSGDVTIAGSGTYDPSTDTLHVLKNGDTMGGRLDFPSAAYDITNPAIRFTQADSSSTDDHAKGLLLEWGGNMSAGVNYPYGIATNAYAVNNAATFTVPTSGYKKWGWIMTHYQSPVSTGETVHQHLNLETVKSDYLTVITRLQVSFGEDIALVSFPNSNVKVFNDLNFQIGSDTTGLYVKHDTAAARIVWSGNTPWNITGTGGIRLGSTGAPGGMMHIERATDGTIFYAKNTLGTGNNTATTLLEAVTSGSISLASKVTGESVNRFSMNHSGRMEWGSGAATRDAVLARTAASELTITGTMKLSAPTNTTTSVMTIDATQAVTNKNLSSGTNTFPIFNQNTTGTASTITGSITESQVTNLTTDLAAKAPIASPTFTGTVTVPTPTTSTGAATKAYVDSSVVSTARRAFYAYEEFVNFVNSGFFLSTGSGTTGALAPTDATSVGIGTLNTGSGATNRQGVWSSNVNVMYFDTTAVWTFETRLQISSLSDGTDTFQILVGFLDVATGESVDGAYFSYTHGTNSGKFETVTASNSVRTRTDSGVTVVANTWYVLKVVVQPISGTLTAQFYINDVQVGGNVTTNIPNTSLRLTGYGAHIIKSAGTNNRYLALDYIETSGYFNGNR